MGFLNTLVKSLFHIDIKAIREENELLRHSLSDEQMASKKKDARLSQMETETKSLKREVANLKSRRTLLEGEISALKYKLSELNGDTEPKGKDNRNSIIQLDTWKIKLDERCKEVAELKEELAAVHKEYGSVANKLSVLQQKYDSVKSELDALRQGQSCDVIALQSECARLSDRLAVITSDRDRLSEQIKIVLENKSVRQGTLSFMGNDDVSENESYADISFSYSLSQIVESILQYKITKNQKIADIISALRNREDRADVYNNNKESHTYDGILSQYKIVEVLPNNSILYSDEEDWYLYGIDDPLASYHNNDEVKTTLLSEKYQIYNLTIKKNLFVGQKPIEFYFFENKIFKFDKSSGIWSLWYSNDETLSSLTDDINVSDDNQLKLIKDDIVLYIDSDGSVLEESYIDEPEYLEQVPLTNGYFIVKLVDGYWGIVDDENNYAVLAQYDMISPINEKYLRFKAGNKWGVMNIEGDILIDAKYNSIESYSNGEFVVTKADPSKLGELISERIEL